MRAFPVLEIARVPAKFQAAVDIGQAGEFRHAIGLFVAAFVGTMQGTGPWHVVPGRDLGTFIMLAALAVAGADPGTYRLGACGRVTQGRRAIGI